MAGDRQTFLDSEPGGQLVELLVTWWTSGEGVTQGRTADIDHRRPAALERYSGAQFRALLDRAGVHPGIGQRLAYRRIHRAFLAWAASADARDYLARAAQPSDDGDVQRSTVAYLGRYLNAAAERGGISRWAPGRDVAHSNLPPGSTPIPPQVGGPTQ